MKQVQADLTRLLNALYGGDVDSVLDATPLQIIKLMGGKSKATEILKAQCQEMAAEGMKLESLGFPQAPTFLKCQLHEFAVVPTKNIIIVRGQRIESRHFQLGVTETGNTNWTFVDGAKLNAATVKKLFPDFPSDFRFPPLSKKKL